MIVKLSEINKLIRANPLEADDYLNILLSSSKAAEQLAGHKWQEKIQAEKKRIGFLWQYEQNACQDGYSLIAGLDEVGRGPLAGPVVAAAVILPFGTEIWGINDSKKVTAANRERMETEIKDKAIAWGIGMVNAKKIDEINILQASLLAMEKAIAQLVIEPDYLLLDAVTLKNINLPQQGIIKGDAKSISIACASILAKCYRDRIMDKFDNLYPDYDFCHNKGYGTAKHVAAIGDHGLCPIHRKSFTLKQVGANG